jgi:HK97 family phage major capsid protein
VIDAFPEYETKQAVVKYMEETTFTNAAAETAEAGAYNAATLVLTERSQTVRKVTVWLPVTDEQLEDETEARSYIDNRLTFMLRQRVDSQALVGDGNAPNVLGTENVSGIQTQALGTDPIFDAAFKLFRKIRDNGFAEPNAFFIAPSKWETVALTRTADGLYILGNPASDIPTRLWGVPGIQTVAGTATKLTAGDYANFAGLYVRRGVDVQVGYNNDDFTKGQLSIRADVRIAVVHFRPKAFGTVTGL